MNRINAAITLKQSLDHGTLISLDANGQIPTVASNRLLPVVPASRVMDELILSDDFSGLIQNYDLVFVLGPVDACEMGEFIPIFHVFAFFTVS
jgi:hypothetical protein